MTTRNLRRNERIPSTERVAVSWDDPTGQSKFTFAVCLNISAEGISMRVERPLPIRSYVTLRSEKLKLAGSASVKYCVRRNNWYQVGVEFNPGVRFGNGALTFA